MPTERSKSSALRPAMPTRLPFRSRRTCARRSRPAPDRCRRGKGRTWHHFEHHHRRNRPKTPDDPGLSRRVEGRPRRSSIVYLAERESDKQQVVLKTSTPPRSGRILLQRFVQEFDIISSIDHPNVVKIYDRGFSDPRVHREGVFSHGSLPKSSPRLEWPTGPCRCLPRRERAASRPQPRRHTRDIKPGNLMARADGSIVLADFGIAKAAGEDKGRTLQGSSTGPLLRFAGADRRQPRDDAVDIPLLDSFLRDVDAPTAVRCRYPCRD